MIYSQFLREALIIGGGNICGFSPDLFFFPDGTMERKKRYF